MTRDAKIHVQPERNEKLIGQKPPIQSQKIATPNLANLTQNGIQKLSRDDILALQQTIGNRAVARLMAQRERVGEEVIEGPRIQREGEEEEEIPGPRMKPLREDAVQHRGGTELRSSPDQRGLVLVGANSGLFDLDGEGLYGWDGPIGASDVADVVTNLIPDQSEEDIDEPERIVIYSGTHGIETGNLYNAPDAGSFVGEDQATANSVMADNPGVEIEVVDVNSYTSKDELTSVYGMTNYIRILAWCYSIRSYHLGDAIKSNWWPEPDAV